jgi:hypothetical protein
MITQGFDASTFSVIIDKAIINTVNSVQFLDFIYNPMIFYKY